MIVLRVCGILLSLWMLAAVGLYWVTGNEEWLRSLWLAVKLSILLLVATFVILIVERLGAAL